MKRRLKEIKKSQDERRIINDPINFRTVAIEKIIFQGAQLKQRHRDLMAPINFFISAVAVPTLLFPVLTPFMRMDVTAPSTSAIQNKSRNSFYGGDAVALAQIKKQMKEDYNQLTRDVQDAFKAMNKEVIPLLQGFERLFSALGTNQMFVVMMRRIRKIIKKKYLNPLNQYADFCDTLKKYSGVKITHHNTKHSLVMSLDSNDQHKSSLVLFVGNCYSSFYEHLVNAMASMPKSIKVVNDVLPELDFASKTVRFAGEMPTVRHFVLLIEGLHKALEEIDSYYHALEPAAVSSVAALTATAAVYFSDQISLKRTELATMAATAFFQSFVPYAMSFRSNLLERWIPQQTMNPNFLTDLDNNQLMRLMKKQQLSLDITRKTTSKINLLMRSLYACITLGLVLQLVAGDNSAFIAIVPFLLGVLLEQGVKSTYQYARNQRFQTHMQLRQDALSHAFSALGDTLVIKKMEHKSLSDSFFTLEVASKKRGLKAETLYSMMRSIFSDFGIHYHDMDDKLLVAADQSIPAKRIAAFLPKLEDRVHAIEAIKKQYLATFKRLEAINLCYHETIFDHEQLPILQIIVRKEKIDQRFCEDLLSLGFQDKTQLLQLDASSCLSSQENHQISKACESYFLRQQPVVIKNDTKSSRRFYPHTQGTIGDTDKASLTPNSSDKTDHKTASETEYSWTLSTGTMVSSAQDNVFVINGHHGKAYILFNLVKALTDPDLYCVFHRLAHQVASRRMNSQGIKWRDKADGSAGHIKLVGKNGMFGLSVYREKRTDNMPPLYITARGLSYMH